MHYLQEEHILTFLDQVLILLITAKVLGELCQRRGIPALVGEILAGILLGPTVLGRLAPVLQARLFPADVMQQTMLDTVSWFGVLFLLLATGFEVSISTVWKLGRASLTIGAVGLLVPLLAGCSVFWWLPEAYWGPNAERHTFTLVLAATSAICAIPVIARVLHDLDVLKSDFGLTALSAFVVNDVLGWTMFTFALGLAMPDHGREASRVMLEIVLFGMVCLTMGSKAVGAITAWLQRAALPQPATTLTFVCCLGLLCGAITQWIGVHAILGFFLAGIMAGNAPEISERTRQTISQMIHAIFVPIFFACIGLKVDLFASFDLTIAAIITLVAVGGKLVGAWLGAVLARLSKTEAFMTGLAHIPGGATEIVLGMLAIEAGLVGKEVFVGILFATISSTVAAGPLVAWAIRRQMGAGVSGILLRDAICLELKGAGRWEAIRELCDLVDRATDGVSGAMLVEAVCAREKIMSTGMEKGLAIPHARLRDIRAPIVAFGRSKTGIDWDTQDGLPARFIFLVLTPTKDESQVQILAAIARMMEAPDAAEKLMAAETQEQAFDLLNRALSLPPPTSGAED